MKDRTASPSIPLLSTLEMRKNVDRGTPSSVPGLALRLHGDKFLSYGFGLTTPGLHCTAVSRQSSYSPLPPYPSCTVSSINSPAKPKPKSLTTPTRLHLNGPQLPSGPIRTGNTRMPPSTNTKKRNGFVPAIPSSNPSSSHRIWSRGCPRKGVSPGV